MASFKTNEMMPAEHQVLVGLVMFLGAGGLFASYIGKISLAEAGIGLTPGTRYELRQQPDGLTLMPATAAQESNQIAGWEFTVQPNGKITALAQRQPVFDAAGPKQADALLRLMQHGGMVESHAGLRPDGEVFLGYRPSANGLEIGLADNLADWLSRRGSYQPLGNSRDLNGYAMQKARLDPEYDPIGGMWQPVFDTQARYQLPPPNLKP